jgi:hypothetical protein
MVNTAREHVNSSASARESMFYATGAEKKYGKCRKRYYIQKVKNISVVSLVKHNGGT